jgi:antitoxin HigA-1
MKKLENRIPNVHPGFILAEDFLKPLGITAYRLSADIGVAQTRISEIIKGKRSITADTAIRLSMYFNTSIELWLGLQNGFDIEETKRTKEKEFDTIKVSELV